MSFFCFDLMEPKEFCVSDKHIRKDVVFLCLQKYVLSFFTAVILCGGQFNLLGTFDNVWRHVWWSPMGQGCYWYRVSRGQGCYWTLYSVQDSPPPWEIIISFQMSVVPRLRNFALDPVSFCSRMKNSYGSLAILYSPFCSFLCIVTEPDHPCL